jgi:hypothetical protein
MCPEHVVPVGATNESVNDRLKIQLHQEGAQHIRKSDNKIGQLE